MAKTFILIFTFLVLAGCGKKPSTNSEQKPLILVSIAPYRFLTERVAGPDFRIQTAVPPGANPHAFEPTASQVSEIAKAEVWFRIGEPFEEKILPILKERNPALVAQDLREKIDLIAEETFTCTHCSMDHLDRHIWMSPKLASLQAETIDRVLSEKFPEKKEVFQRNREALQKELLELDQEITTLLKEVTERVILVSHPAFGYFCRDYQIAQLSVEYEGKDPRPKHLEQILSLAISQKAEVALALPQYNNKGAQLIAEKLNLPIRLIDPYSPHYFETMRKLAGLIADPQNLGE